MFKLFCVVQATISSSVSKEARTNWLHLWTKHVAQMTVFLSSDLSNLERSNPPHSSREDNRVVVSRFIEPGMLIATLRMLQEAESSIHSKEDFTAVPAAPKFQPVPEFQPLTGHGLLTDQSTA